MIDRTHKFKVGQTVDFIPSTLHPPHEAGIKSSAFSQPRRGNFRIIGSRVRSESYECLVAECDLLLPTEPKLP